MYGEGVLLFQAPASQKRKPSELTPYHRRYPWAMTSLRRVFLQSAGCRPSMSNCGIIISIRTNVYAALKADGFLPRLEAAGCGPVSVGRNTVAESAWRGGSSDDMGKVLSFTYLSISILVK